MQVGQLEIQLLANVAKLQKDMDKAVGIVDRSSKSIAAAASVASQALAAFVGSVGIREIIKAADTYATLQARIGLVTKSTQELVSVQNQLIALSERQRVSLDSTVTLYTRAAASSKDLNASQADLMKFTEGVSAALTINGTTAQAASGALLQLSQAIGGSKIQAQEFNSLIDGARPLLQAVANNLDGAGGSVSKLTQMVKAGEVSSRDFFNAAVKGSQELIDTASKIPTTFSQALQIVGDTLMVYIGQANSATNATGSLAQTMVNLAKSDFVKAFFQTLAVLGANVAYVFRQIGDSLGGWIARLDALVRMDFESALVTIPLMMEENAKAARAELDRVEKAIMNPAVSGGAMVSATGAIATNATTAAVQTDKAAKKTSELMKWYESENKRIQDEIRDRAKEDEDYRKDVIEDYVKANLKALKEIEDAEEEKRKRNQKASDEYLADVKRKQEAIVRENERMADNLQRSLTDAILRGFEYGKGFAENFKDTLINMFKTLVLRPVIEAITSPFAKAFSGIGASLFGGNAFAADSLVASGGGIGNIFGTIREGLSSLNTNVVGSIEKLGVFLSNGNGGLADKIGGFFGQYSSQIATSLSFAPAVFSLLKGDLKGAAFQGGGAAIGTLLGGPVGGAIGSFLGGALGSVFGGKKKNPRIGALVSGTYSTATDKYTQTGITKGGAKKLDMSNAAAIGQVNEAFLKQLGGFLDAMNVNANIQSGSGFYTKKGKKSIGQLTGSINGKGFGFSEVYGKGDTEAFQKYVNSVLGTVMVQAIQASPLSKGLRSLFANLTSGKQVVNMMNAVVELNEAQDALSDKYAITVDQAAQAAKATGLNGRLLTEYVQKLTAATQTVGSVLVKSRGSLLESLSESGVNSLPSTLKAFDDILQGIDKTTKDGIKSFSELFGLREQFAAFTQSIDQLKGGVNSTLMPFLTAQEQQAIQQAELVKVFDTLNMSVPGSLQELIELGKGIDYTTKEGLDLAAVFPSLVQAFQNAKGATDGLIASLTELDPNKFRTLVDFTRAQRYQASGIPLSNLPSYDVGTSFVPETGPAMIHRGERILTAAENREYSAQSSMMTGQLINEIRALRADIRSGDTAIAIATQKSAKILDKFDREGILLAELDNDGNAVVVPVEIVA
jgi:tape measure domain-containing protein